MTLAQPETNMHTTVAAAASDAVFIFTPLCVIAVTAA
jgi:hypothetical protein